MLFRKYIHLSCIPRVESYLLHRAELAILKKKHKMVSLCNIIINSRKFSLIFTDFGFIYDLVYIKQCINMRIDTTNCNFYIRDGHGCIQCPSIRKLPYLRVHILYMYFSGIFMRFQVKTKSWKSFFRPLTYIYYKSMRRNMGMHYVKQSQMRKRMIQ